MSAEKPENKQPDVNDTTSNDDPEQSEALKQAILKLRDQGLLTHVPEELIGETESDIGSKPSANAKTLANRSTKQIPAARQEPPSVDETRVSPPKDLGSDNAASDDEAPRKVEWTTVSSSWDEPAETDVNIDEAKVKTRESQRIKTISPEEEKAIALTRREIKPQPEDALTGSRDETPWTLQQFFDGEIDLDKELSKRFPTMPPMTTIKFRTLGSRSGRKVATLSTQDGNATVIFDADIETKVVQMSFTYGSMLTLRFSLSGLNDSDRTRWLELMRREQGGLAFLWGPSRWQEDYLICISRNYSTNFYAFSPRNFESAIRMTTSVTEELLNWLEEVWTTAPEPQDDDDSPLLTW